MSARISQPITLFSGLLGHGKTLMAVTYALEARVEGQDVFQIGVKGCSLEVALPWVPDGCDASLMSVFDGDEGQAERLKAFSRWRELPRGSILLVDEAQDYLPVRAPGRPPEWIAELAKLRHYGVQLWLVTQDPRNIDSFVRRLIGAHVHIERKAGLGGAVTFRWERCAQDPTDYHARKNAVKGAFSYPKRIFDLYTSSSQHLVKRSVPWQLWATGAVVVAALVFVVLASRVFMGKTGVVGEKAADVKSGSTSVASPVPSVAAPSLGSVQPQGVSFVGKSVADYVLMFVPRVATQPWSAPAFDDRRPIADPQIFCVVSEVKGCRCYTEQVTRISGIPDYQCRLTAEQGVYNPFKAPLAVLDRSGESAFVSDRDRGGAVVDGAASVQDEPAKGSGSRWPSRPDFSYRVPFPKASPIGSN